MATQVRPLVSLPMFVAGLVAGLLLFAAPPTRGQSAPGYLWTVPSATQDTPLAVSLDAQGFLRTFGNQFHLHSYDTNGQLLQSATCTNSAASFLGAAFDSVGNLYAAGQFTKNAQFGSIKLSDTGANGAMFLAKYNPAGVALWAVGSTGGAGVTAWAVSTDPAGNSFVVGEFMGSSTLQVRIGTIALNNYTVGTMDAFIAKVDPSGKILWATRFGDGAVRRCMTVAVDKSGNAYAGGNSSLAEQRVYKFSSTGILVWARMSKAASSLALSATIAAAVAVDEQGNVCVTGGMLGTNLFGTTKLSAGYNYDLEVTKYDSAGNVLWACKDGSTNADMSTAIVMDPTGNAFVLGSIDKSTIIGGTTLTNAGGYIAKCNSGGGFGWALPTPHLPNQSAPSVGKMAVAPDGSVYVAVSGALSRLGVVAAPVIITQPTNQMVATLGATALLTVDATPARTLSYQWFQGIAGDRSRPIPGGFSNVLTTPAIWQESYFWVRVSNPAGNADSATVTITIPVAPKITSQPSNSIIARGESVTLSVVATGSEPMGYQWYQIFNVSNYVPIPGPNSNTYTTGALTNSASFMVQITNGVGGVNSAIVGITVVAPVQITQQPQSMIITNGQKVTLSVVATGGQALLYQWYVGDSGNTNSPLPGQTLTTYTTPPLTGTARYWVMVSSVASQTAVLSLPVSPSILEPVSLASGKLNFRITGQPGTRWAIQTSSDLIHWASDPAVGTVVLDATGATDVQVQPPLGESSFYRASLLN